MLLQKRRFFGCESPLFCEFAPDNILKISFLGLFSQLFASTLPFEFHHRLSRHQPVDGFRDISGKNIAPVLPIGENLHSGRLLQLQCLQNRAVLDFADRFLVHV